MPLTKTQVAMIEATGTPDATSFLRGDGVWNTPPQSRQLQSISASVASNALTISASALTLDFRSTTLGNGTVTTVTGTPANLVVPASATLGTVNNVQSRLIVIALNNAGTIELAVVNIAGGTNLDETNLLSTTAISSGSTSSSVVYSTSARTSLAYRVIGSIDSTQTTAGTWAAAPSLIQGAGGNALDVMGSLGYGQTWQNLTGSRAFGTTYYNTTGKPIYISVVGNASSQINYTLTVNGQAVQIMKHLASDAIFETIFGIIPVGASYIASVSAGTPLNITWCELR